MVVLVPKLNQTLTEKQNVIAKVKMNVQFNKLNYNYGLRQHSNFRFLDENLWIYTFFISSSL